MGIKVEKKDNISGGIEYPYLGQYKDSYIVLFYAPDTGTVVCGSDGYATLGQYLTSWNEDEFTLYTGSITLSNILSNE